MRISVRTEALQDVAGKFRQSAQLLSEIRRIAAATYELIDWESRVKAGIDAAVSTSLAKFDSIQSRYESLSVSLTRYAQEIEQVDQLGAEAFAAIRTSRLALREERMLSPLGPFFMLPAALATTQLSLGAPGSLFSSNGVGSSENEKENKDDQGKADKKKKKKKDDDDDGGFGSWVKKKAKDSWEGTKDAADNAKDAAVDTVKDTAGDVRDAGDYVWNKVDSGVHLTLDGAGLVPGLGELADGLNAGIYALEGDMKNAGLSLGAMVPFVGWGSTGVKFANRGAQIVGPGRAAVKGVDRVPPVQRVEKVGDRRPEPDWKPGKEPKDTSVPSRPTATDQDRTTFDRSPSPERELELSTEERLARAAKNTQRYTNLKAQPDPAMDEVRRGANLTTGRSVSDAGVGQDQIGSIMPSVANEPWVEKAAAGSIYDPPYDVARSIRDVVLPDGGTFVRVHGPANAPGHWAAVRLQDIQNLSPEQIREKLGLAWVPTHVSDINVPPGTTVRLGTAGPQSRFRDPAAGGGPQLEVLLESDVPPEWMSNKRELKKGFF